MVVIEFILDGVSRSKTEERITREEEVTQNDGTREQEESDEDDEDNKEEEEEEEKIFSLKVKSNPLMEGNPDSVRVNGHPPCKTGRILIRVSG